MLDFGFYNMDCMEGMREFPDKYFELAIVDPPYGVGGDKYFNLGKGNLGLEIETKENKQWDSIPSIDYFNELRKISKNQIIWGGNYFTDKLLVGRCWLFWDKKPVNPVFSDGEFAWTSFFSPSRRFEYHWNGVIRSSKEKNYKRIHPTQKPVALYRWLLQNYAKSGWKILDTHVGSASSLIACEWEGFDYVGFEIDEEYYTEAKKRLETWRKSRMGDLFKEAKISKPLEQLKIQEIT